MPIRGSVPPPPAPCPFGSVSSLFLSRFPSGRYITGSDPEILMLLHSDATDAELQRDHGQQEFYLDEEESILFQFNLIASVFICLLTTILRPICEPDFHYFISIHPYIRPSMQCRSKRI